MRAASGLGPTPPRLDRSPGRTAVRGSADMPGLSDTAYDTAWVAAAPAIEDRRTTRFPSPLQWLVEHLLPDGSWGGVIRYEHDRVLCTLAALVPLATFGRRATDRHAIAA